MPDIRYVCLSDTHFGAATSLLTNLKVASDEIDGLKPSPVLEKLVECLRYLIDQNEDKTKKPTLVLNGDILELALADDHDAAMTFERFIDLIMDDHREKCLNKFTISPGTTIITCGRRPGKASTWTIFPRRRNPGGQYLNPPGIPPACLPIRSGPIS